MQTDTEFIVMTAATKMPASSWGRYAKVAVCEVEKGVIPKMISERAKGMVRIVHLYDRLHVGGVRSAFQLTLTRANAACDQLNREQELKQIVLEFHAENAGGE